MNTPASTAALVLGRLTAARGQPLSGQQIADELKVSRNAVWKAVRTLRDAGCVIDAGPRAGYRLVSVPEPLDEECVLPGVDPNLYRAIHYVPATDSTNDVAKQHAKAGAPEGTVVITNRQLHGRGRRGRAWETTAGQSLLFSIVLRPDIPPRQAPLLVFLAAAAVRAALAAHANVFIKWPNDIVAEDGRKLCGILVEMDAEHDRVRHCIVGIGVNVSQRQRDFAPELQGNATSVQLLAGAPVSRLQLLQTILNEFAQRYTVAVRTDFAEALHDARRFSATLGRRVRVHEQSGDTWNGTAVDLRSDGALLVRPAAGADAVAVYAADVSIRMEDVANEP